MKTTYIIRAISGNHALLRHNEIPIIGQIETKQRKNLKGEFVTISELTFYFGGNKSKDHFEFIDGNKLLHYAISKYTPEYINKVYEECIARERNQDEFVKVITSVYVFHEIGF